MSFKLVLKVFKFLSWLLSQKTAQPVELSEEPIDRKLNRSRSGSTPSSIDRGSGRLPAQPVESAKNFLFLPEWLFNRSRLNLNWLRSD